MKLQQAVDGGYFIRLPKTFIRLKGWKKSQELVITTNDAGNIVIQELKQ